MLYAVERVVRDIEPEHLPLVAEQRGFVPLTTRNGRRRPQHGGGLVVSTAKEGVLPDRLIALDIADRVDALLMHREQATPALTEGVESAGLDE